MSKKTIPPAPSDNQSYQSRKTIVIGGGAAGRIVNVGPPSETFGGNREKYLLSNCKKNSEKRGSNALNRRSMAPGMTSQMPYGWKVRWRQMSRRSAHASIA